MMELKGIRSGISPIRPNMGAEASGGPAAAAESFGRALAQAVDDLRQAEAAVDAKATQFAAGEPVDLHNVMIAVDEAGIAFDLALQVRNKIVEAYQEISRMPV